MQYPVLEWVVMTVLLVSILKALPQGDFKSEWCPGYSSVKYQLHPPSDAIDREGKFLCKVPTTTNSVDIFRAHHFKRDAVFMLDGSKNLCCHISQSVDVLMKTFVVVVDFQTFRSI